MVRPACALNRQNDIFTKEACAPHTLRISPMRFPIARFPRNLCYGLAGRTRSMRHAVETIDRSEGSLARSGFRRNVVFIPRVRFQSGECHPLRSKQGRCQLRITARGMKAHRSRLDDPPDGRARVNFPFTSEAIANICSLILSDLANPALDKALHRGIDLDGTREIAFGVGFHAFMK